MNRFVPFAMRFDERREVELISEALSLLRCDNAPDALRVKDLRKLIDDQLEGTGP